MAGTRTRRCLGPAQAQENSGRRDGPQVLERPGDEHQAPEGFPHFSARDPPRGDDAPQPGRAPGCARLGDAELKPGVILGVANPLVADAASHLGPSQKRAQNLEEEQVEQQGSLKTRASGYAVAVVGVQQGPQRGRPEV